MCPCLFIFFEYSKLLSDSTDANDVPIEWKQKYCVLNQNGRKLILHEEDEEGEVSFHRYFSDHVNVNQSIFIKN